MSSEDRDVAEQRRLLRSIGVLANLADAELDQLLPQTLWHRVSQGQEVLSHLTTSSQVYFLITGVFRAQMTTAYGKTVAIRKLHAGAHIGEIAALTGAPRSVSVIAETDGLVAEWSPQMFKQAMQNNALFAEAIAASLARNVILLTDRLFELAALEVRFRLYAELLRLAHHGETSSAGILVRDAPTHEMMAAAIGAQREAVTREISQLTAMNILEHKRRELLIKDLGQLQKMVQQRAGLTATQVLDWQT
ncbi:MAG: Crp/Fnr family transcriptional regulator [Hyphomonadaceae bacterium]